MNDRTKLRTAAFSRARGVFTFLCAIFSSISFVLLLHQLNMTLGFVGPKVRDGNTVSECLEFNLNYVAPAAAIFAILTLLLCLRVMEASATPLAVVFAFVLVLGANISFGRWFFGIALEGVVALSDVVWWLKVFR